MGNPLTQLLDVLIKAIVIIGRKYCIDDLNQILLDYIRALYSLVDNTLKKRKLDFGTQVYQRLQGYFRKAISLGT